MYYYYPMEEEWDPTAEYGYVYDPYIMCYECAEYNDCDFYPECEGDWE